jgi:hypothetical protein
MINKLLRSLSVALQRSYFCDKLSKNRFELHSSSFQRFSIPILRVNIDI